MTRHPCCSDEWLDAAIAAADKLTREHGDLITSDWSVVEIYTDVPAPYGDDDGQFVWHVRSSPGRLEVGRGDLPGAGVRITVDYATVLPIVQTVIGDDERVRAQIAEITAAARAEGRMRIEVNGTGPAANPLGSAFHDAVSMVTA